MRLGDLKYYKMCLWKSMWGNFLSGIQPELGLGLQISTWKGTPEHLGKRSALCSVPVFMWAYKSCAALAKIRAIGTLHPKIDKEPGMVPRNLHCKLAPRWLCCRWSSDHTAKIPAQVVKSATWTALLKNRVGATWELWAFRLWTHSAQEMLDETRLRWKDSVWTLGLFIYSFLL